MYEKEIELLQNIIDDSGNIVFFGGAGVSTESNIPDFRSADGIYHQKYKYSPEQVVSHSFFMEYTETFYDFYKEKMMILDAVGAITEADTLIIGGTSLVVYPAAGFIDYFRGRHLVVINKSETAKAVRAELNISAPIGQILGAITVQ